MVQVSSENRSERLEWSPPVLEQLTVDLDAIAGQRGGSGDSPASGSNQDRS